MQASNVLSLLTSLFSPLLPRNACCDYTFDPGFQEEAPVVAQQDFGR
jgi:hypothetical protein